MLYCPQPAAVMSHRQIAMQRARAFGEAARRAIRDGRAIDAKVLAQIAAQYANAYQGRR